MPAARTQGMLAALAAAVTFAGVNVGARRALELGLQPLWMVVLSYLGGSLVMAPFLRRASLARTDAPRMAIVVLAGAILAPVLLFFGLQRTTAADASLVLNLEMAFTGLFAVVLLRERMGARESAGLVLLAGAAVAVSLATRGQGTSSAVGLALVAAAALMWAVDNTASTPLARTHDARGLIAVKTLSGGAVTLVAALALEGPPAGGALAILIGLAAGVFGVALSSVLFYFALGRIGAARTTALFATSGLFGVALAGLLLREPLGWPHALAASLAAAGILAMASKS